MEHITFNSAEKLLQVDFAYYLIMEMFQII